MSELLFLSKFFYIFQVTSKMASLACTPQGFPYLRCSGFWRTRERCCYLNFACSDIDIAENKKDCYGGFETLRLELFFLFQLKLYPETTLYFLTFRLPLSFWSVMRLLLHFHWLISSPHWTIQAFIGGLTHENAQDSNSWKRFSLFE